MVSSDNLCGPDLTPNKRNIDHTSLKKTYYQCTDQNAFPQLQSLWLKNSHFVEVLLFLAFYFTPVHLSISEPYVSLM